jgi:AlwI restriction endonuclease
MRPWHLGNTTVRSPFRLRDGLIALSGSTLLGDVGGREKESAFAWLLHDADVVALARTRGDDVSDLGRKWRAAMTQLGFIVPELNARDATLSQAWLGPPFTLTANGRRLISAEAVPAIQECFLRSLAAYRIPSALERDYHVASFSPLRHTLKIMLELERRTGDSHLNFIEMATVVQLTSQDDVLGEVCDRVLQLRANREASTTKRQFDNQEYDAAGLANDRAPGTFRDYADLNFRYLKATGLLQSRGRGVAIVPEKHLLVAQLVNEVFGKLSDEAYLRQLCAGASLPTDNKDSATLVLDDLLQNARSRGIDFDLTGRPLQDAADIAVVRFELEDLIAEDKEVAFAAQQIDAVEEISAYMRLIAERGSSAQLSDGSRISVPKSEAPAYFEWVLWRAFLAMNRLVNKPYESRRFKIDQDFLPIGCAPGGGPDLIFEFDDFVIVAEVTLTESSRQEAAEGEPVRRHVADIAQDHALRGTGKAVYGLFLANRIDSNTAETFRIGVWYLPDDSRTQLDIVPLRLSAFHEFFDAVFRDAVEGHVALRGALNDSIALRQLPGGAPAWKTEVDQLVRSFGS